MTRAACQMQDSSELNFARDEICPMLGWDTICFAPFSRVIRYLRRFVSRLHHAIVIISAFLFTERRCVGKNLLAPKENRVRRHRYVTASWILVARLVSRTTGIILQSVRLHPIKNNVIKWIFRWARQKISVGTCKGKASYIFRRMV